MRCKLFSSNKTGIGICKDEDCPCSRGFAACACAVGVFKDQEHGL